MSAPDLSSITDNFFPAVQKGYEDTLNGSITDVATTIVLNSVSGFSNGDSVFLWIEPGASAAELVYGIVDTANTQLTNCVRGVIGAAAAHTNGATVAQYVSSADHMLMRKGLLVEHGEDGTHTDITATTVTTSGDIESTGGALKGDTVSEHTGAHGVTIDGLNIKDSKINTADALNPLYMTNPYKFRVSGSNTPLTSNVWTKAILANEDYDTNNNFDATTNYRYTAPVDGFYHFSALATVGSAGLSTGFAEAAIYKNGSAVMDGLRITGSGTSTIIPRIPISGDLELVAGDYIELWGVCSEGGRSIAAGSSLTYLSGHLISAT